MADLPSAEHNQLFNWEIYDESRHPADGLIWLSSDEEALTLAQIAESFETRTLVSRPLYGPAAIASEGPAEDASVNLVSAGHPFSDIDERLLRAKNAGWGLRQRNVLVDFACRTSQRADSGRDIPPLEELRQTLIGLSALKPPIAMLPARSPRASHLSHHRSFQHFLKRLTAEVREIGGPRAGERSAVRCFGGPSALPTLPRLRRRPSSLKNDFACLVEKSP
jgi:hypothetical protein